MSRLSFNGLDFGDILNLDEIDKNLVYRIVSRLTITQQILFKIYGTIKIGQVRLSGWKEELPFYLFKCEKHGFQMTYPSGHSKELHCPVCLKREQNNERSLEIARFQPASIPIET